MFNKLEPSCAAIAFRMAISKPHLTLGKIEDGYTTEEELEGLKFVSKMCKKARHNRDNFFVLFFSLFGSIFYSLVILIL